MATISEVGIANIALAYLGEDSIRDFGEDNKRARMCQTLFNVVRDSALVSYDWSFARKTEQLQALAEAEQVHPRGIMYAIPSDCLTPIRMFPRMPQRYKWYIEGSYIIIPEHIVSVMSDTLIYLEYTRAETNVALFTKSFVDLVAADLAARLSPSITQDKALTNSLVKQYYMVKSLTESEDAARASEYRYADEDPNADTFVTPEPTSFTGGFWD